MGLDEIKNLILNSPEKVSPKLVKSIECYENFISKNL